jgi:hypothetical protein
MCVCVCVGRGGLMFAHAQFLGARVPGMCMRLCVGDCVEQRGGRTLKGGVVGCCINHR